MAKRHSGEASPVVASASPSASAKISPAAAASAETPKKSESPAAQSSATAAVENSRHETPDSKEEADTRQQVLTRVDLMRNISQKEKDQLYAQIVRAHGFTKIALIPF